MKKIGFICLLLITIIFPINAFATNEVNIYFFNSNSCSICKQEEIYLQALKERYPNIRVYSYEISNSDNNDLMLEAKKMFNISKAGVPFTVIGDTAYLGFSQNQKAVFQKKVYEYSINKYKNELGIKLGISYRDDLTIKVKEYKDNDNYIIEETSGNNSTTSTSTSPKYDEDKICFYLILAGVILAFIAFIISRLEKRGRI